MRLLINIMPSREDAPILNYDLVFGFVIRLPNCGKPQKDEGERRGMTDELAGN
jgi:hypothetical protein